MWLPRAAVLLPVGEKGGRVLEETQDTEELIGRVGTVRVAGTRRTVSVSGARIRGLLGFKSTKFSIRSG